MMGNVRVYFSGVEPLEYRGGQGPVPALRTRHRRWNFFRKRHLHEVSKCLSGASGIKVLAVSAQTCDSQSCYQELLPALTAN